MTATKKAEEITRQLVALYPDRSPLLDFDSPFQLLISVILSAQTTDAQVNLVTPALFAACPTPRDLAEAPLATIEDLVHSTGFYRNKAKNIIGAAAALEDRFGGLVPQSMDDLTSIPGVGRKSANVIRGVVYGLPSIVVDTHLSRVSNRIGFVETKDPSRIERQLRQIVPEELQTDFSMGVNLHGRYRCHARQPRCAECELRSLCFHGQNADI